MKTTIKEQDISEQVSKVCELSLKYKRTENTIGKINKSQDTEKLARSFFDQDTIQHKESFWCFALKRNNEVIGAIKICDGGSSSCIVDVKFIAQTAILTNCDGIIIAHNHPSGNLRPSESDITITKKIKEALNLFDVKLLDHIILTKDAYTSMSDNGYV